MLLTTSSAGAIVHSAPLTKFAVTGRYEVRPGVFKKKISTQQSTGNDIRRRQRRCGVALKNGGGAAALGGGGGWRLKIAAAVLGGGGGRRTCDDGIGISVVEAEGLLLGRRH
jgi:hypothetical protein